MAYVVRLTLVIQQDMPLRNLPLSMGSRYLTGIISHSLEAYPSEELYRYAGYLKDNGYGTPDFSCKDYDALVEYMRHDKKNITRDSINFTLLSAPGHPLIDRTVGEEEIHAALDIFRDLLGI